MSWRLPRAEGDKFESAIQKRTTLRLRPDLRPEFAEDQVQHRGEMIGTSILLMVADL